MTYLLILIMLMTIIFLHVTAHADENGKSYAGIANNETRDYNT